jgi:hypothetical protein
MAGTVLVQDITGNAGSSNPSDLVLGGSTIFFAANDGVHGRELWGDLLKPLRLFLPLIMR